MAEFRLKVRYPDKFSAFFTFSLFVFYLFTFCFLLSHLSSSLVEVLEYDAVRIVSYSFS